MPETQSLVGTLIQAAEREEVIIEKLVAAVESNDHKAMIKAAREIAENRNPKPSIQP